MPGPRFFIRRATSSDIDSLADLAWRSFEHAFGPDNEPEAMQGYLETAFTPQRLGDELDHPSATFLLAFDEAIDAERPVGYAKLLDGSAADCVVGENPVELVRLYVDPDVIGKRYGAALMNGCLEAARQGGHDILWLGVWENNKRAIHFYRKWGLDVVGDHDFVMGDDVQKDLIMVRRGLQTP